VLIFSVVRGSGALAATLTASSYRISIASLPVSLQLSVLVTNPDGLPLEGAAVTFSLTVPGIPPVAKDAITGGDGRATYTTTLSGGLQAGPGLATVLVATTDFGTASTQKTITIVVAASTPLEACQLPSGHADVAVPPLRHAPGGDGPVLGLPPIFDHLFDLSALPPLRGSPAGLLRPRPPAPAARGHRAPRLLGGRPGGSRAPGRWNRSPTTRRSPVAGPPPPRLRPGELAHTGLPGGRSHRPATSVDRSTSRSRCCPAGSATGNRVTLFGDADL
jgi:hypothetical protein